MKLSNNKDLWAGAMLIATGAATVIIARNYAFGTTLRMGPGYFPTVLGGILILFGLYLVVSGLRSTDEIQGSWPLRAMIVLPLALVLFGVLMTHAGFLPALLVLIFGSALAGPQFKLVEVLLLAAALSVVSVALFVWGLGLPYPLIADY
ncbi:MAG TPA: tripartite tricarboxylate transporter TctB family protein [Xanthobacteraceae bacterium]|nr:tripartite tricarboxylate transporter TctB family protein [Xanthobacteraceae bacterium]